MKPFLSKLRRSGSRGPVAVLIGMSFALDAGSSAALAQYQITDLGDLGGGWSRPVGVDDSGAVVGFSGTSTGGDAFIYRNGAMSDLNVQWGFGPFVARDPVGSVAVNPTAISSSGVITGYLASWDGAEAFTASYRAPSDFHDLGPQMFPTSINARGTVVGFYRTAGSYEQHPFAYAGGTRSDIAGLSTVQAINDAGVLAGAVDTSAVTAVAATSFHGVVTLLGTLGGGGAVAIAVNASGTVVGNSRTAGNAGVHAFSYHDGAMVDLGALGRANSEARGINDAGVIVGNAYDSAHDNHPFVIADGVMTDLNDDLGGADGWTLVDAVGVNNQGQIVGDGRHIVDGVSEYHAFLLTPAGVATCPEAPPLSWAAMIAGLGVFAAWRRARSKPAGASARLVTF